jgi:hypothetical protein
MKFYKLALFIYFTFSNLTFFTQTQAQNCRIKRIEFSDTSFYNFKYDAQDRLSEYRYDSESENSHRVFQYIYNEKGRISHITCTFNDVLEYVCSFIYDNNIYSKRRVAFFERKIVRDEIVHYNEQGKVDKIDFRQSNGDTILMRFDYDEAGYPFRRVRLSNDFQKNTFSELKWDTTLVAINPFETLFENYPLSNIFDREIGNFPTYPTQHPVTHYIQRTRDELGNQLYVNEWIFSDFKVNEQGYITDMKLVNHMDDKTRPFIQKNFYENCASSKTKSD